MVVVVVVVIVLGGESVEWLAARGAWGPRYPPSSASAGFRLWGANTQALHAAGGSLGSSATRGNFSNFSNGSDGMNRDAVHESAMAGDVDGLAAALSAAARLGEGSVLTELNEHGWSPLHCASIAGDRQAVNMLLTAGANSNAKSSQAEETPLHFAAAWDHREVVDTLLSRGAFLDETNHAGATALHKACEYGAENAAAELLQRGASCLLVDSLGRTPLHVATKHNASTVVLQLLAAGADVDATDSLGRRPVDLASAATAELLTVSSDDHPLHVWLADKGLLEHADLFRSYGVTVDALTSGIDEQKLQDLGMPVGVRLKVL
eukprot:COSAG02_NODE_9607_length_2162_cov_4.068996_3_plen_320_part_01